MANYTVADAVRHVRAYVKNIPTTDIQILAADTIEAKIWRRYPWRWTTAAITPISLVDQTQDYGSAPTDYFRLKGARIVRTDVTPNEYYSPLDIVNRAEPNLHAVTPRSIRSVAYLTHLDKFRLERAVTFNTSLTYQLVGEYQKQPPKITYLEATLASPDMYFDVFVSGLDWLFKDFAEQARAGTTSRNPMAVASSGAEGRFWAMVDDMASAEGYAQGDILAPAESLTAE